MSKGYISASLSKDKKHVIVWLRDGKDRIVERHHAPYYFYAPSNKGTHKTIDGYKVKRVDFDDRYDFYETKQYLNEQGIPTFESDIPPEIKILLDKYYDLPPPELNITFLDIEVDYNPEIGFAAVENPYAPINSVALYHKWLDKYVLIAVPPDKKLLKNKKQLIEKINNVVELPKTKIEFVFVENERELLLELLCEINESDVLCGWNSSLFDIPYIGKRLELLGKKYFKLLSFPEGQLPQWEEMPLGRNKNITVPVLRLDGRINADYLHLFKKFEEHERQSYKLEAIADEFFPDLPKIKYEGTLAELYRKDFPHFIRYNIRDTEILRHLEDRLGYVQLANVLYHLSCGVYDNIAGTLKLAEYAVVNYCHHVLDNLIVPDSKPPTTEASIQGALVLEPKTGMHEWIGSIDINSLYPHVIMSLNISPETLIGQFDQHDAVNLINEQSDESLTLTFENKPLVAKEYRGKQITKPAKQWKNILKTNKWVISGYGTVFTQQYKGIVPTILQQWYSERKKFKKQLNEAIKKKNKKQEDYFYRLQYVYKIKLNSFYGAFTNPYFKFYDLRAGESVTRTGRMILAHQCAAVCEVLDGKYQKPLVTEEGITYKGTDYSVIYSDTDSAYFLTHCNNREEAIKVADHVCDYVNKTFKDFMQNTFFCNEGYDDLIRSGREIISDRGIFVEKKRYILHVVDQEGHQVDKLKIMGIDTKRTTLPKYVSDKINKFFERYLKGEDWESIAKDIIEFKEYLKTTDNLWAIGLPKNVNNLEEYTMEYQIKKENAKLPGHVAASIFYNICREKFGDKISQPIISGTKIMVFYLTKQYGKFKSLALPLDIEQIPQWFIENFEIDREAHVKRLVDNPLENVLKAVGKKSPTKQSLFVDTLLEF